MKLIISGLIIATLVFGGLLGYKGYQVMSIINTSIQAGG